MLLYNDTHLWQGGLGYVLGLFLLWDRNELMQTGSMLSISVFIYTKCTSEYVCLMAKPELVAIERQHSKRQLHDET